MFFQLYQSQHQNWSLGGVKPSLGDELHTVGSTAQTSATDFKPYIQCVPTVDLNLSTWQPVIGFSPDLYPWQLPSSSVSQLQRYSSLKSATPAYEQLGDWSPIDPNMFLNFQAGGDDMPYD